jgi:hypothetical protein
MMFQVNGPITMTPNISAYWGWDACANRLASYIQITINLFNCIFSSGGCEMTSDFNQCYCKLDDGTIIKYDMALTPGEENKAGINMSWFNFLGHGVVYSINGRRVSEDASEKLDFYVRKSVDIDLVEA